MTEELYLLTLLAAPRIGPQAVRSFLKYYSDVPDALEYLHELLCGFSQSNPRISALTLEQLRIAQERACTMLDNAARSNIKVLTHTHPDYPKRLFLIKNPPVVLFVRGDSTCLREEAAVAIIGTRQPSDYGARVGQKFGAMFAQEGFVVVSGLAIGCDTQAHKGCLEAAGRTVAVMAHGLDTVYPAENKGLAQEIIDSGGCLVSEYPPKERARRNYFIDRDRLQSGLSAGVVVIETDIKGGTMHTVGFCLEEKKPLACLLHPLPFRNHAKANGNWYLIKRGDAAPLRTPADVVSFANMLRSQSVPFPCYSQSHHDEPVNLSFSEMITIPSTADGFGSETRIDNAIQPREIHLDFDTTS